MILFNDRQQAGEILAKKVTALGLRFASPPSRKRSGQGNIPASYKIIKTFNAPLDIIVLRKLPIPQNPEAGFNAVTLKRKGILI